MPDPWKGDMRGAGQPGESPSMNSLPLLLFQLWPWLWCSSLQAECLAGTLLHVPCPGALPAPCLPRCHLTAAVHRDTFSWVWLLPAMAQKFPLKPTFLSRVCVFLPFQPFLPSLQNFQSLTFSSHSSVFQSQAAEQAQGVTSTPPSKAQCRLSPVLGPLLSAHGMLHIFPS